MGKRMDIWEENYEVIWNFASENHRGPSRHRIEEHTMLNWLKYNRKIMNKGELDEYRKKKLLELVGLIHSFNRVNQYC